MDTVSFSDFPKPKALAKRKPQSTGTWLLVYIDTLFGTEKVVPKLGSVRSSLVVTASNYEEAPSGFAASPTPVGMDTWAQLDDQKRRSITAVE